MPPITWPYAGLTVVNASRGLPGATAAQLLAGLGARVIRVEETAAGEQSPSRDPLHGWDRDGDLFAHFGRGSESVQLDLARPDGLQALTRLASGASVVIEDERPSDDRGVRAAIRTARDSGASFSLATITPFGLTGPWMDFPSSSLITFAMSGLMSYVGEPDREPVQFPAWLVQTHVGLAAFTAIASSIPVDGSAVASHDIDIAELDVIANSNPHAISEHSYTGGIGRRAGSRFLDGYPWTVLPCKDGFIGVIVPQTGWDVFALWIDRPDLIDDPRFVDRFARRQHPDEFDEIFTAWSMQFTKDELYRDGQARHLPFGAVYTAADSLASEQLADRKFFDTVQGTMFAGLPFLFNGERPTVRPAPAQGEHTEVIASEFHLTATGQGAS